MKNILIIGDALSTLKVQTDSSLAIAQSGLKLGHRVYWCEPQNLTILNGQIEIFSSVEFSSISKEKFEFNKIENVSIKFDYFHFCLVRKDPPFDEEYKNLCWLLASQNKVNVLNDPGSLLTYHEKSLPWKALNEGIISQKNIIPTCVTYHFAAIDIFCNQFPSNQKYICKPWLGHGGENINLLHNKKELVEFLKIGDIKNYMIQPFLEKITFEGDRRVIIANGEVICDYVRLPALGKIASNGAQGGSAILRKMTSEQLILSKKIAQFLKNKKIYFAGLDLIGEAVGEINITSPTGIRIFEQLSQVQVCDKIFNLLIS